MNISVRGSYHCSYFQLSTLLTMVLMFVLSFLIAHIWYCSFYDALFVILETVTQLINTCSALNHTLTVEYNIKYLIGLWHHRESFYVMHPSLCAALHDKEKSIYLSWLINFCDCNKDCSIVNLGYMLLFYMSLLYSLSTDQPEKQKKHCLFVCLLICAIAHNLIIWFLFLTIYVSLIFF